MARSMRASGLETRTARLKLPVSSTPVWVTIGRGLGLGYRRNKTDGSWVARVFKGKARYSVSHIGRADDYTEADGSDVLDYWQAQAKARQLSKGDAPAAPEAAIMTLAKALDRYEADLVTRGGDTGNASRLRGHLSAAMLRKPVVLLTMQDFRKWRDGLAKTLAASSVNRTATAFKAALNLAADSDERIVSRRPWEIGLATIPDADQSRNVILSEGAVREIVVAARTVSAEFGMLVEIAAVTGARMSQLARIEVQDLQADRDTPRLMMPTSKKGKGKKAASHRPSPITPRLAAALRVLATGRPATAPLLVKPSGEPWKKSDHARLFTRTAEAAGQGPEVTLYALRHTSIVRQLLANVPARLVAVNHDTSIAMLEKTYSHHIDDHGDAFARGALIDIGELAADKVVPIRS